MESKKINQLATELAPELSDLTIIGDPTTGISKKITLSQMASLFTGTVEEYANLASFPLVGTADTIYIALDTNIIYRWNTGTSAYVELSPNIVTSLVFNDANGFDGTISLVGSTATLTITTALTQGSIGFIGASGALTQDNSNFFWDNTNKRLGINTNTPTTAIDAFGSGIIGRLNGTSTNNAFLGFASAGSNKWSIGNVQSDHRFRIYSEANTAELVSVLQTGEVGIGIANPLTKLHIFGGASALIANLDANTSVAKSISFRSGNSSRINLEVSGTESGSNAGMNFYLRAYTDAGALLSTPLTITRSTGAITLTGALSGTTATFSGDLTLDNGSADGAQLVLASSGFSNWNIDNFSGTLRAYYGSTVRFSVTNDGIATFTNSATFTANVYNNIGSAKFFAGSGGTINYLFSGSTSLVVRNQADSSSLLTIANSGAATFSSSITAGQGLFTSSSFPLDLTANTNNYGIRITSVQAPTLLLYSTHINSSNRNWGIYTNSNVFGDFDIRQSNAKDGDMTAGANSSSKLYIKNDGNIGINTVNPNDRLVVVGANNIWAGRFSGTGTSVQSYGVYINAGTANGDTAFLVRSATEATTYFYVRGDGLIGNPPLVGTHTTSSGANMYADPSNGAIYRSTSSLKYKKNVEDYTKGLNEVMKLRPVSYEGKNEIDNGRIFAGLIAEEVHNLGLTEYVQYAEDGTPDALAYQNMVAILIKSIQELKSELDILKAK